MGTSMKPKTGGRPRVSGRADSDTLPREEQFDLLTATLIGIAIGAGATMLLRQGPRGRPITPVVAGLGRGARAAGALGLVGARYAGRHGAEGARWAGEHGRNAARWAAERGEELIDRVPAEEIADQVREYVESAQETINSAVESELRDLRRAIKRQRKRLGI